MNRSRNERLILLTQTEIMFVFASIILILLLAENYKHGETEDKLATAKEEITLLRPQAEELAAQAEEKEQYVEEVNDILVREGLIEKPHSGVGAQQAKDTVEQLVSLWRVLDIPSVQQAKDAVEQLVQEREAVGNAQQRVVAARVENEDLRAENEALRQQEEYLVRQNEALHSEVRRARYDAIGCVPCWLRENDKGYYFTYGIKYDKANKLFQIKPHWQENALPVREALRGELSILRNYPRGWLSRAQLADFGRQVRAVKNRVYGEKCKLTTKISENADGKVIKFVRDKAGFCPIYE